MIVKVFQLLALPAITMSLLVGPVDIQKEWEDWKSKHNKRYESSEEEQKRFEIFEKNVKEIVEHNEKFQAGEESYSKGLNNFADLNPEELPKGGLFMKR